MIRKYHFIKLFFEDPHPYIMCSESLNPNKLKEEDSVNLISPFLEREIEEALSSLGSSKSPGPDGLKCQWSLHQNGMANFERRLYGPNKRFPV